MIGSMRIHLYNGTVRGQVTTTEGEVSFAVLAHYTEIGIVLQWNASGAEVITPENPLDLWNKIPLWCKYIYTYIFFLMQCNLLYIILFKNLLMYVYIQTDGSVLSFAPMPGNSTRNTKPPAAYKNNPKPVCKGSMISDTLVCMSLSFSLSYTYIDTHTQHTLNRIYIHIHILSIFNLFLILITHVLMDTHVLMGQARKIWMLVVTMPLL